MLETENPKLRPPPPKTTYTQQSQEITTERTKSKASSQPTRKMLLRSIKISQDRSKTNTHEITFQNVDPTTYQNKHRNLSPRFIIQVIVLIFLSNDKKTGSDRKICDKKDDDKD